MTIQDRQKLAELEAWGAERMPHDIFVTFQSAMKAASAQLAQMDAPKGERPTCGSKLLEELDQMEHEKCSVEDAAGWLWDNIKPLRFCIGLIVPVDIPGSTEPAKPQPVTDADRDAALRLFDLICDQVEVVEITDDYGKKCYRLKLRGFAPLETMGFIRAALSQPKAVDLAGVRGALVRAGKAHIQRENDDAQWAGERTDKMPQYITEAIAQIDASQTKEAEISDERILEIADKYSVDSESKGHTEGHEHVFRDAQFIAAVRAILSEGK